MGGIFSGAVTVALVVQIARDIAARNAPSPRNHGHDMGKILADAPALFQRRFDRGIHFGDAGLIFKGIIDTAL